MTGHSPHVVLTGLARRFGPVTAVAGLDLVVGHGDLFGVVGPDGAGKTTLLRMLGGVLRPTAGDAEISGVSVARQTERVKHEIAYMSQRFGLYADLTVAENIAFYADQTSVLGQGVSLRAKPARDLRVRIGHF